MLEQATIDTMDETKETTTAVLVAIISFALRFCFFEPFELLDIPLCKDFATECSLDNESRMCYS